MKKITIGIVDDNRDFCDVVAEYLRSQDNMEIMFVANDGLEAVEMIENGRRPDVLVLDLIMPHMDGLGVLETLNNMDLPKYPRVVMTSAIGQDSIIQKAMSMGAQYYLVKPVNMSLLVKRINQLENKVTDIFRPEIGQTNLKKSLVLRDSLLNNALEIEDYIVTGSRGWFVDPSTQTKNVNADFDKINNRELIRLKIGLDAAKAIQEQTQKEIITFFHFPLMWGDFKNEKMINMLHEYGVVRSYFGHIHGNYFTPGFFEHKNLKMRLISADFLDFMPLFVQ